jgi:PAS domain S-box-containing protein
LEGGIEETYWSPINYPVLDAEGRVSHLVHQSELVTELIKANNLIQAVSDQGDFTCRLDLDGRVIDVNRSALELGGFTRDDVMGKRFWDCGWWNRSPAVQSWVKAGFEQAVAGEPFRGVSDYFCADGSERVVEFACMPIKDESGKVLFVTPTGIDVTERFQAERDKQATAILESISDGFFAVDRNWRFTYVNRQAERILGKSSGDFVGKSLWDVYPGLTGSEFEAMYRRVVATGVAESATIYYPDHGRWYKTHAYPTNDGASIYFRDVSERKRADADRERLVAESENQRRIYETALSNIPDLVYVFNLEHRFIYANQALLTTLGRTHEQAIGKNCLELGYEPWHASLHDREIEQVIATARPIRGEVPFNGTNGRRIYDYIFVPVMSAEGVVVAVAGTTRDVTDRKQAEQAISNHAEQLRENDRSKDEFLAMLAHELRNPLAAIGNAVSLTTRSGFQQNIEWAMGVITRQMKHLTRLIDDLLDVSRITRGKIELRKVVLDLTPILESALATVRPLIEERKHTIEVSLDRGNLWVDCDPTRLEQVVVNLLNNAAKYSDNGGHIQLSAHNDGHEVVISVRDQGVGIPPEKLPQMFELFAQGDRSLARSEEGLGIGLTVVKKLVELHGGQVTAESGGIEKGSAFTIRLPAAQPTIAPRQEIPAPPATSATALRILVVDDNIDTARGMSRLLKLLGHDVATAHAGPDALEIARDFHPEFVLLDIGLPGMDGYEVASRLRKEPRCQGAVIVAVSGYGQDEDLRRSKAAGFDHHLIKPLDHDALLSLLSQGGHRQG